MEGKIFLGGRDLAELSLPQVAGSLGIVFQDPESQLFLPKVLRELAFGPENLCLAPEEFAPRLEKIAEEVGCQDLLSASPEKLSGGEQQLVALAAVLALEPQVLILDEVSAQLDSRACRRLGEVVEGRRRQGTAVLMVEHNLGELAQADRILVLKGGCLEEAAYCDLIREETLSQMYGGDEGEGIY